MAGSDVIVLGAGMVGVSSALHLQKRGQAVVLVDRRGAGEETSWSPTRISPTDGSTKPAIKRSVVVLPQPDGPSRQTSLPWSMVSVRSWYSIAT